MGGGITAAGIARDAALRGRSEALVETGHFAGATSSASSKLIHGGLRYLQNLELGLVRESLRERRIWSNVAPHMVDPLTFLMPTTSRRIRDRLANAIGLTVYDWLAYDRNRLDDPEKAIPAHKKLSREEVVETEPGLASDDLTGAMVFYDYLTYSPERLALECILSAAEHGADVANYAEVIGFIVEEGRMAGVRVRDVVYRASDADESAPPFPRGEYVVRGRVIANAAGPWADLLMGVIRPGTGIDSDAHPARHLIRSKGIHLLTRALTKGNAIAVQSESSHFFILPWRGHSILGTTDVVYKGDPSEVHVTEKDIVDFLSVINKGFPGANLRRSDVLYFYAGLRPIVDTSSEKDKDKDETGTYTSSRAAEVYDHETEEGVKGIITAIGGKWTTSRNLAEQVVNLALTKLGITDRPCTTAATPTFGGDVGGRFAEYQRAALERHGDIEPAVVENLVKNYGSRFEDVLALTQENPQWAARLTDLYPDIAAEIVYAVRNEMALTVEDMLFRRTGLGTIGSPGEAAIARVGDIMAKELGWNEEERAAQIDRSVAKFTSWARSLAIVNPRSWGNRTGALWPEIESRLRHVIGPIKSVFTDSPKAATRLTAQALKEGMEQIIAVGGDGTVNEVVNGFFEDGKPINPEALLATLTSGTGRDFGRTFQWPLDVTEQIERLAVSEIQCMDIGKLTYTDDKGKTQTRLFDNVASFGLSGATDQAVNRLTTAKRLLGGKLAFQWGMLKALIMYRNQPVRLRIDDTFDEVINVTTVAVCNGQFFGSGMQIAPNARPDDGMFEVIVVENAGKIELLRSINSIYKGEHLKNKRVRALRGRKIIAEPAEGAGEVVIDMDGETPGRLPATFEIVPNALFLRR
ncbi:MAG: glycerol-3-phosphate dehydrogenase [Candidatus Hydrogenedentes bacterium]|nr:glycerol-3-phosphate dehydrogenase [Candidatus Hydrogenedentota bacterium]